MTYDFTYSAAERDQILFGEYDEKKYMGGIRRFDHLPVEKLELLIENNMADPEDRQNSAPSIGALLEFGKAHGGVTFSGYAVSRQRPDCRVSIDGMEMIAEDKSDVRDFLKYCSNADELCTPETDDPEDLCLSAWWD